MQATAFAKKFIEKITEYTDYNINIMDEDGIIIASKDKERVGTFHEIAYRIVHGDEDIVIVGDEDSFLGVKSGVNMSYKFDKIKVGVIGITGDPKEVKPIALVVKMSIETMMEYEIYKEKILQRKNTKEHFMNFLLNGDDRGKEESKSYAEQLGYDENLIRIPILIVFENKIEVEGLLKTIKKGELHSNQDISTVTEDNQIIIFKHFPDEKKTLYSIYKYLIGEYLSHFLNFLLNENIDCKFYIGTFQTKFKRYSKAYQHCLWLQTNTISKNKGIFFYDYIGEYMKSLVPTMELHSIYHIFSETLDEEFKELFIETIGALIHNNYNMVESSKELFIHKNTLVFRFNKIRERFDLNPMQNSNDREFINLMYYYLIK